MMVSFGVCIYKQYFFDAVNSKQQLITKVNQKKKV